jgi:hypothetical protein
MTAWNQRMARGNQWIYEKLQSISWLCLLSHARGCAYRNPCRRYPTPLPFDTGENFFTECEAIGAFQQVVIFQLLAGKTRVHLNHPFAVVRVD